ncbi:hypothetical protein WISP_137370 [Willisornis vidua]|uniref:Uncharacterized protein n=1 Tax=Willisornis vidua TaxID=1566151 RepID=A0ABQ9CSM9_9PASS|nr:hypothetical protein WISP_137370 [Willisornis vidua]
MVSSVSAGEATQQWKSKEQVMLNALFILRMVEKKAFAATRRDMSPISGSASPWFLFIFNNIPKSHELREVLSAKENIAMKFMIKSQNLAIPRLNVDAEAFPHSNVGLDSAPNSHFPDDILEVVTFHGFWLEEEGEAKLSYPIRPHGNPGPRAPTVVLIKIKLISAGQHSPFDIPPVRSKIGTGIYDED